MQRSRRVRGALPAVLVLVLLVLGWDSRLPYADARGAELAAGPAAGGYPYALSTHEAQADAWGFRVRQCTSFAAWYLNSHGVPWAALTRGPRGTAVLRDAATWAAGAADAGFAVSSRPRPGSIAQWDRGEASLPPPPGPESSSVHSYRRWVVADDFDLVAGEAGHVAVVLDVLGDGTVITAGYDGRLHTFEVVRTRAPRYLYIGLRAAGPRARRGRDGRG